MCELIARKLACGDELSPDERAHIEGCPRCSAASATVRAWRPRRVSHAVPELARVRTVARRRVVVRAALVAAIVLIVSFWPRPTPEPDLLATLDDLDEVLAPDMDDLFDDDEFDPLDPGAL